MITRKERACFAAGDLGFNFIWHPIEVFLLFFYVERVGLPPAAAASIFAAGALADWILDPLVGVGADRLAPRIPLRLWVAVGGPAAAAALFIAFAEPGSLSPRWRLGWALGAHLLVRIAYSIGNIPYGALTARITDDPAEQLRLTTARMQGAALGGMLAAAAYALSVGWFGRAQSFEGGAAILALLGIPAFAATSFGVKERVATLPAPPARPLKRVIMMVRFMAGSPPLRRLILLMLAAGTSVTALNKSLLFLLGPITPPAISYLSVGVGPLALLTTAPLWLALARRTGRARALNAAALLALAAVAAMAAAGSGRLMLGLAITAGLIASAGLSIVIWSLVPAVVTGVERSGAPACAAQTFAMANMARKLAQAIAPQFIALGLAISSGRSSLPGVGLAALIALVACLAFQRGLADD